MSDLGIEVDSAVMANQGSGLCRFTTPNLISMRPLNSYALLQSILLAVGLGLISVPDLAAS